MPCIAPSYLCPCGSPFVPFTWRHLQWGHIYRTPTLAVHNPPGPQRTSVSKWAIALIFLFFSIYSLPLLCCLMKDEVLNTSVVTSLWGRHSSICDPSWCNWILHPECNMEHDLGVPLPLPFFLFLSFEPLKGLCCGSFGKPLCVRGTDVLNDDRWQTRG